MHNTASCYTRINMHMTGTVNLNLTTNLFMFFYLSATIPTLSLSTASDKLILVSCFASKIISSLMSESNESMKLTLYSYWRSSCAQRVQIALNLKGLEYEYRAVNLSKQEQCNPEFEKINPIKYVPALVDGDVVVADSFAINLYLEEKYPQHPLLPKDLKKRALNIQITSIVSSSIQPVYFIPAINFIEGRFSSDEKLLWAQHHINKGFTALEKLLKDSAGKYATGDEIQMGDVFLEPQIYAGLKCFQIDMFPTLARLHDAYMEHPAFQSAVPENQPDAPKASILESTFSKNN